MLVCTVRDCHAELRPEGRSLVCSRGHSFDIARSGYINLLQPQDRRSKLPGDSATAVAARRRLHDRGVTQPLLDAIVEMTCIRPTDTVLDCGCGEGFYLGSLARQTGCAAHGVDISIPAVDAAAKRYPPGPGNYEWIVANADRFLPYTDGSFSRALSITGRMNSAELRRVLRDDGKLLVGIPSPDDLVELRSRTGEAGLDRTARTVKTFATEFELIGQERATTVARLSADEVEDVLHSIYRPRQRERFRAMRVTFSLDLLLFRAGA